MNTTEIINGTVNQSYGRRASKKQFWNTFLPIGHQYFFNWIMRIWYTVGMSSQCLTKSTFQLFFFFLKLFRQPNLPSKRLELTLNKFTNVALPLHLNVINQHAANIERVRTDDIQPKNKMYNFWFPVVDKWWQLNTHFILKLLRIPCTVTCASYSTEI